MGSFLVRYEDLLADPLSSLREITKILGPVPEEKIRAAVLICQAELITQIRLIPKEHIARFKKDYLRELPLEACEAIINLDAFAKTYKEFEYDVDPQKGLKRFDYGAIDPFKGYDQFDNGVSIDAFVKYIYYCIGGLERWTLPYITEGDSFWNWLFMPNEKLEKVTIEPVPYYTNFLNFLYEYRRDLRAAFPDVLGIDYPLFLKWAFFQAPKEYRVSWQLFAGVRDYYLGTMPRLTWPGAFPVT